MSEKNITGKLIDCFYENNTLFLTIKHSKKEVFPVLFFPYFYVSFSQKLSEENIEYLQKTISAKQIILEEKENISNIYKVLFEDVSGLVSAKDYLNNNRLFEFSFYLHEYDIPFIQRFFLDKKLTNFIDVTITIKDNFVVDITPENRTLDISSLEIGCFDIEVLVSEDLVFPDPKKQPIISISYMDNYNNKYCFIHVKECRAEDIKKNLEENLKVFAFVYNSEKEMVLGFLNFLAKKNPDILYTYNGVFDLNYLDGSYKRLFNEELKLKNHSFTFHKYPRNRVSLKEIVHIDVYQLLKNLRYFQAINYSKLDLNTVYTSITNKPKITLKPQDMRNKYLNQEYLDIVKYNLDDVAATMEIADLYVNFIFGICTFVDSPTDDILFFAASMIVEKLFIGEYVSQNKIIPNKPNQYKISGRKKHIFKGAFVYQPSAGVYKNIAVVDFRTYHVSLLIAYNISPETVNAKSDYIEINSIKIFQKKKGFVPYLLKSLIEYRAELKRKLIEYNKTSVEYKSAYGKQFALKTLIASIYGYMGFAGARWYCSECLDAMYFLVREKIKKLIDVFKEKGYVVLYGDTDSCFVQFKDITKLKEDISEINKTLPENMMLELEDIFKSGIFVKSRDEKKAAKKKYALLDFNNDLKIKGFEFVRRDWCKLVKDTQKEVLHIVLEKQNPKEAVAYVKEVINKLKEKEVSINDLIIQSFVHKHVSKYKTKNPAQSALISAKESGHKVSDSEVVEYIITDKGKSISEKARLKDLVNEKEYDVSYYIEKQLIPAVFSILNVFDVSKEELISNTKQRNLNDFFT